MATTSSATLRALRNDVPVDNKTNAVTVGPTNYAFAYDRLTSSRTSTPYQVNDNKRFRTCLDIRLRRDPASLPGNAEGLPGPDRKNGIFQEGNAIRRPPTTSRIGMREQRPTP
jgi:hypothetical protein